MQKLRAPELVRLPVTSDHDALSPSVRLVVLFVLVSVEFIRKRPRGDARVRDSVAPLSRIGHRQWRCNCLVYTRTLPQQTMSLNDTRLKYFFFVGCAVAPLSMLGSSLILTTIYRRRKRSKLTTYHRLLMGISVSDLLFSTAVMFGPLPMPEGLGIPGAHGNTRSCTAQGFFAYLGIASMCYNQMLMLYFVMVIRYSMTDSFITRRVEPFMHLLPIVFYGGSAVLGLFFEVYNPNGSVCLVAPYPPFCEDIPQIECTRGAKYGTIFGVYFVTYPFLGWVGLIFVWLLVVSFTVVQKVYRSRRFVFEESEPSPGERQMRQAIVQCLLYASWFLTISIFTTMNVLFGEIGREYRSEDAQFWYLAFAVFLFPLGGFMNFAIFIRPFYLTIRKDLPNNGRWFALWEAIWHPSSLSIERARRGSSSTSHRASTNGIDSGPIRTFRAPASSPANGVGSGSIRALRAPASSAMNGVGSGSVRALQEAASSPTNGVNSGSIRAVRAPASSPTNGVGSESVRAVRAPASLPTNGFGSGSVRANQESASSPTNGVDSGSIQAVQAPASSPTNDVGSGSVRANQVSASSPTKGVDSGSIRAVRAPASSPTNGVGSESIRAVRAPASLPTNGFGSGSVRANQESASSPTNGVDSGSIRAVQAPASSPTNDVGSGSVRANQESASSPTNGVDPGSIRAVQAPASSPTNDVGSGSVRANHESASSPAVERANN